MKTLFALSFLICQFLSGIAQTSKSEVLIISTIHGAHKINPNYSYDSLFTFVEKFNPDIIGVEIRNEDIDSSVSYLKDNYPFEMYTSVSKFSTKKVIGFDWLGAELAGHAIPQNYWKEKSTIKKLQQKLSTDSTMLKSLSVLDIINDEKNKLVLSATIQELNDGRYDLINRIYYEQLELLLKDTQYNLLSDFYKERDEIIARNILEIIKNNDGKKMIFLLGADHRDFILRNVSEEFKDTIILNDFAIRKHIPFELKE
ncbi:MAG: hypothetical protein H6540_09005 [Bacteroidales bacterium]|nr:hypothetical protein [Bacteroidales bacterium]MCB9012687.1 hypothetical protein [Bacteroidales bacterium]